jgi:cation diffusion facilitator family transporter
MKTIGAEIPTADAKIAAARLSLLSNSLLTVIKLTIGIFTGSVSVISEGAHSLTDVLASGLALYTVRKADLPPDADHPYGHGKMENLSALTQGAFLFGIGGYIIYEAVHHLLKHAGPQRVDWGMGIMAVSATVNIFIVRYVQRTAEATNSASLRATAQDHRADIYTAIGVLIGLILVRVTGNGLFDPLLALGVALVILHGAWGVASEAAHTLLDQQLPAEDIQRIRQVFDSDANVLGYHKLKTRRAGSIRYVDAHVLMDDNLTLLHAHELTEELEASIRAALPQSVATLHTEPFRAEQQHQQQEHGGPPADEITKEAAIKAKKDVTGGNRK